MPCLEVWTGLFIPKKLFYMKNLTWIKKILFANIQSLENDDGCRLSNKYLAKDLGVSEATISNGISKLKSLKLVKEISFDGRVRTLKSYYENLNYSVT